MNAGSHPVARSAGRRGHHRPGKSLPVLIIDFERCTGCGLCIRVPKFYTGANRRLCSGH
ncbi:MAG: 4Fe-4S binding protein [Anaerolineae bacterium]|nr:4Fe-4S binding protein [Anaerolineae bacterium]